MQGKSDKSASRAELSPADRAHSTARRKELHEEKNPETKHGAAGAKARWNASETVSSAFTSEVASINGKVERVVQLDVQRGTKIREQKGRLGHGNLLPWIEAEFGISRQTADNFVHVAETFGDELPTVGNLPRPSSTSSPPC